MKSARLAAAFLLLGLPLLAGKATRLAEQLGRLELDPDQCYQVREVNLFKQDIRMYFTEGHLIFAKPIEGRRLVALFSADVQGGDAELLTFPPDRGERRSMARATGSPNLSEHFKTGLMVFTDGTAAELLKEIERRQPVRRQPEAGLVLASRFNQVARNLTSSFEMRISQDVLNGWPNETGFFYAALASERQGNFDVVVDPQAPESILLGTVGLQGERRVFQIWSSFQDRDLRMGRRQPFKDPVEIKRHSIRAEIDRDLHLSAVSRLRISTGPARHAVLLFEIAPRLEITRAVVNGAPAEVYRQDSFRSDVIRGDGNGLFLVEPSEPLEPGREYDIEIHHKGDVISQSDRGVYYVGARGNWYPARGLVFTQYDYSFRYPAGLDFVTTGEDIRERTEGEWKFAEGQTRNPIRLLGFNLGRYQRATEKRGEFVVEVCANQALEKDLQPQDHVILMPAPRPPFGRRNGRTDTQVIQVSPPPASAMRLGVDKLAANVADAFAFFAGRFGPPPIDRLTVSPVPGAFGQGFPGLVYLSTLAYLLPTSPALSRRTEFEKVFFTELLFAHETAHQWWGNSVRAASYRDEWMMEALADYSSLLFFEKRKGPESLASILGQYREHLLARADAGGRVDDAGPIIWGQRLKVTGVQNAYQAITYEKGAWIFHMLRGILGDPQFFAMLSDLRRDFEFQAITTDQLRQHAARYLPKSYPDKNLEIFFDQFVYDTGIPTLTLKYEVTGKPGKLRIEGEIRQADVPDDFSIYVPVEIRSGKTSSIHWVRTDAEPVTFSIPVPAKPQSVRVNPGDRLLAVGG